MTLDDIEWVEIPAGHFLSGWLDDPEYNHKLTPPREEDYPQGIWESHFKPQIRWLPTFYISRHHYGLNPQHEINYTDPNRYGNGFSAKISIKSLPNRPFIMNITGNSIQSVLKLLSNSHQKGVRLPTLYEWEKAARGPQGSMVPQKVSPYGVHEMGRVFPELLTTDDPKLYICKESKWHYPNSHESIPPRERDSSPHVKMFEKDKFYPLASHVYTGEIEGRYYTHWEGGLISNLGIHGEYTLNLREFGYINHLGIRLVKDFVDEHDTVIRGTELPEPTDIPPQPLIPKPLVKQPYIPYKNTLWQKLLDFIQGGDTSPNQ